LTHITKQEIAQNRLLNGNLQRAANIVQTFLEKSVQNVQIQVDMRDRPKLGEKMSQLFELNGPQTYAEMIQKQLIKPEVHVIVLGSSELTTLFPSG
jgi:hypothetical protein